MSALHLLFKIADTEYAVPAGEVFQMEIFDGATPVPGAPAHIAGLVQLRQRILPVIDSRVRFGLSPRAPTIDSRLVVLNLGSRLVALLVDSAREVYNFAESDFQSAPEIAREGAGIFVKAVATVKGRLIMLIDAEKLVGEEMMHG